MCYNRLEVINKCIDNVMTKEYHVGMNTTIQIRIDKGLKVRANKLLQSAGLDLSSGIKLFLSQVVRTKSIPFPIRSADDYSPAMKRKLVKETEYALKHGKSYSSIEELHKDILKD